MKTCSRCKETKELKLFSKNKKQKSGLSPHCKSCAKRANSIYYQSNKQKILTKNKLWKQNNSIQFNRYQKDYRVRNKEKQRQYIKKWKKDNKNKYLSYQKLYNYKRKQRDNVFKLRRAIRFRIKEIYKSAGFSIQKPKHIIIGCTSKELLRHLINSALKNYGFYLYDEKYHIDHIIPISTATSEEELILLNHYSNLQLLYPEDNLKKSNKVLS